MTREEEWETEKAVRLEAQAKAATAKAAAAERTPAKDLLYGSDESIVSDYGPSLAHSANRLGDAAGWTEEETAAHVRQAARVFSDAGIRAAPAEKLHSLVATHTTTPPDDATVQKWTVESRRQLREQYGADDAARRMKRVNEYLGDRPELSKLLTDSGVGSHPEFVTELAARADSLPAKKSK